ncbi:MAG: carbonic anhydrase [Neisseriaceae bacterium]
MSSLLSEILEHNRQFLASGQSSQLVVSKYPRLRLAILSCMDARMTGLLPRALGLREGDAQWIKNAGAVVLHPWGSVMSSLLIAVYELGVEEIMVIGHHDCGARGMRASKIISKALDEGISQDDIDLIRYSGIDLDTWLKGFDSVNESVLYTVQRIHHHPLLPRRIAVHGLIVHPSTGELTVVEAGT